MFSIVLNKIDMDSVAVMMRECQAQSLIHWILVTK